MLQSRRGSIAAFVANFRASEIPLPRRLLVTARNFVRRATLGQDVAPLQPVVVVSASGEVREELPFHLRDYLKYDDLFRYGMTPQFVSRFESIVVLNDLAESDLARIFVEPEASK